MNVGPVGILGGAFNPVHNGHLRSAVEIRDHLGMREMRLMPAASPPHRPVPDCSASDRARLVELAVESEPGLVCDTRELRRGGPSYTVDSLEELRSELGETTSLCLVMGADAVARLDGWHRWRDIGRLAHIVVIARPGWEPPGRGVVADHLRRHSTDAAESLRREPCGYVLLERMTPLAISSTHIRRLIAAGRSPRYLLPDAVWRHIQCAGLYGRGADNPA